jgi:hypothetical protein
VIGAALCVSALAFSVDLAFAGVQRLVTPPSLRGAVPPLEPDLAPRAAG